MASGSSYDDGTIDVLPLSLQSQEIKGINKNERVSLKNDELLLELIFKLLATLYYK